MSVREQQKQATRARVLDAARDLFDQVGYEETTIRAIAEKAGVSVGSVFTTFCSKAEILGQVMAERIEQLARELEVVVPHLRGSACDRISALLSIHYEFQMRRPKLFLAYIGASFAADRAQGFTPIGSNPALRAPIFSILQDAAARGELRPDLDVEVAARNIISIYSFNYLRAADGADAKALGAATDMQLQQLFEGFKGRAGVNPSL